MALVLADRVRDTTTTTGTGTVTLSGTAPTGFQSFAKVGNGNTTYYTISGGGEWEVGIGTYSSTGTTLSRDTVLDSSNSGSLVNFSAGTKDVFVTYPSEEAVYQDGSTIKAGTAILGAANGGTGANTLTANAILKGNGTSAVSASSITDNGTLVTIAEPVRLSTPNTSSAAWTTSGINLIQSAATFTDTTSTGTVADVRVNQFNAQTVAASNAITVTSLYGAYFAAPLAGTNVTATNRYGLGVEGILTTSGSSSSFNGTINANSNVFFQTSSSIILGSTTSTTAILIGQSTASQTLNLHTGTTASGSTKTVNIGTSGASGSTTNITLGSATSGATQTTTINGRVTLAPIGASAAAWTTNGIGLVQSAATFTDTSSTGTVADVRVNNFAAQTIAASNTITITSLYGAYFTAPVAGTNVTATSRFALGSDSIFCAGTLFTNGSFQSNGTSIIAQTTATVTASIAAATTASGSTKTVNIGTGGASGSTTTITIGSSTSGATSTTRLNGVVVIPQGSPASYSVSSTITGANMAGGLIQFTGGTSQTLTTDTGTNLDTAFPALTTDSAIEFSIWNSGSIVTIAGGTGVTIVAKGTIAANSAVLFRLRKTGTATYTLYQIAG